VSVVRQYIMLKSSEMVEKGLNVVHFIYKAPFETRITRCCTMDTKKKSRYEIKVKNRK